MPDASGAMFVSPGRDGSILAGVATDPDIALVERA
jgi:hypothetical protein